MQIDTNVDEADIGMVAVGQEVKFTVDAFPDDVFEGKVTEIRMSPIIFQMVVTYDTIVSVNNSALKLKPGMTASTSILVATKEQVMKVPNAALRYTPSSAPKGDSGKKAPDGKKPSEKSGAQVWLLERGKLKQAVVKPGIADDNFTEISSDAVKEGMEVVTAETSSGTSAKTQQKAPWGRSPRM
jgi:HlyD family secretion protein